MMDLFTTRSQPNEDTVSKVDISHDKSEGKAEEVSRFSQLRSKLLGNFMNASDKQSNYALVTFSIPTVVVPSEVAAHFSQASAYFPSTLRKSEQIPIDQEESERFDVVWERRRLLERFDTARHKAADKKREQMMARKLSFVRIRKSKRAKLASEKKLPNFFESGTTFPVFSFGSKLRINPSKVASHFRRTKQLFSESENTIIPIEEEKSSRFKALHDRRELIKEREYGKLLAAEQRRMLTLAQIKQKQNDAGLRRATRLAALRVVQNSIEANYWGIPTEVFPAYLTGLFHRTSSLFSHHYLYTLDPSYSLPLEDEEKLRFVPLWDRRMERCDQEEERNVAAFFRRDAILKGRIAKLQAASMRREKRLNRLYERKEMAATAKDFGVHSKVTPSVVASHFPNISKRFGASYSLYTEQIKHRCEAIPGFDETQEMPLEQEELVRFAPLWVSRQCRAAVDHHRCLRAAAKREANLSRIRKEQQIAGKKRERVRNLAMNKKREKMGLPAKLDASNFAESLRSNGHDNGSTKKKSATTPIVAAITTPMASITHAIRNLMTKSTDSDHNNPKASTPVSSMKKRSPAKASKSSLSTPSSWLQSIKETASAHLPLSSSTKGASSSPSETSSRSPSKPSRSPRQATGTKMSFSANPSVQTPYPSHSMEPFIPVPTEIQLQSKHFYEEAFIPDTTRISVIENHFRNTAMIMEKSTGIYNIRTQNAVLSRKEEEQVRFVRLWKRRSLMINRDHQRTMESEGRALAILKAKKDALKAHNAEWLVKSKAMRAEFAIHAAKWAKYDLKMQKEAAARRAVIIESRVWQQQQDDKRRKERHYAMCNPSKLKKDAKLKLQRINDRVAQGRKARIQILSETVQRLHKYHQGVDAKVKKALKARHEMEDQPYNRMRTSENTKEITDDASTKQIVDIMDFFDNRFAAIQSDETNTRKLLTRMENKLFADLLSAFVACKMQIRKAESTTINRREKEQPQQIQSNGLKELEKIEKKARNQHVIYAESSSFNQILRNEQIERDILFEDEGNTPSSQASAQRGMVEPQEEQASLPIILSNPPVHSASAIPTSAQDFGDNLSPTAEVHPQTTPKSMSSANTPQTVVVPSNDEMLRHGFPPTQPMYYSGLNASTNNASTNVTDPNDLSNPTYVSSMSGSFSAGSKSTPLTRQSDGPLEDRSGIMREPIRVKEDGSNPSANRSFKQIFSEKKPRKLQL